MKNFVTVYLTVIQSKKYIYIYFYKNQLLGEAKLKKQKVQIGPWRAQMVDLAIQGSEFDSWYLVTPCAVLGIAFMDL